METVLNAPSSALVNETKAVTTPGMPYEVQVIESRSNVEEGVGPTSISSQESDASVFDVPRSPPSRDHILGEPIHEPLGVEGPPEATMDEDDHGKRGRAGGGQP